MRVFLITAFVALTVASPDIGLLLRQQQQGSTGYEYQPQQLNHQLYQQQQTFTVNHNENPSQLTQSKSEVFFIKYETQQEADENYARAPTRINPNELPREEQYSSGSNNLNNNYLPSFQQQQGYYYQPQHHQQHDSQYNNQQQQIFTPNTQDINLQSPEYTHKKVVAPVIHSIARPPSIILSNNNHVAHTIRKAYLPSIQVNQNILQSIENNEALKPCFSSNNEYLPWF